MNNNLSGKRRTNKLKVSLMLSVGLVAFVALSPTLSAKRGGRANKVDSADNTDNADKKGLSGEVESPQNGSLVQAAYTDLTSADHDYDGHRAAAAASVRHFADAHHITLVEGERAIGESQADSDSKLRDALAKIEGAIQSDNTQTVNKKGKEKDRKENANHLDKAVAEIKTALDVR